MQGVINSIVFGVEDYAAKNWLKGDDNVLRKRMQTGMASGFFQSFVCTPMELVKLHTQHKAIGELSWYKGNWATFIEILRKGGVRGCYQGFAITMFRDTPAFGVYFATYEGLLDVAARRGKVTRDDVSYFTRFMAGGIAGVASWAWNYPVDLVKTRIQLDGRPWNGAKRHFKSSLDCLVKAWKEGGVRLLYRGFTFTMIRAFVFNMFAFPTVDKAKEILNK